MAVDNQYEFTAHEQHKDGNTWIYSCKYRKTPKMMCQAKARVSLLEDKWILKSLDGSHKCEPNEPKVLAEFLRHTMKNLVRENPTLPVGKAIRQVKVEAVRQYSENEELYSNIVSELGPDSALDKQMYRVRQEVIGPTPKSRNDFIPKDFLLNIFNDESNTIVMDSNNLDESWRRKIDKTNPESECNWEKYNDEEIQQMDRDHNDTEENDKVPDIEPENDLLAKDLPKRVLSFSSKKLLYQLSLDLKSSVDGTFKSSCVLWKQLFIWMVKKRGYWTPVVWSWLPDKSETSYKIFLLMIQEKMEELGFSLKVSSVLCDFELSIMKSIDTMLKCDIHGCFFHHKYCFQRRVDKFGFKTRYESDKQFRGFINELSGLSHLPIEDIASGLWHVENKYIFEDEKASEFKDNSIKYYKHFWLYGCIPPKIWSCFGRSEDLTNNNQEGKLLIIINIGFKLTE